LHRTRGSRAQYGIDACLAGCSIGQPRTRAMLQHPYSPPIPSGVDVQTVVSISGRSVSPSTRHQCMALQHPGPQGAQGPSTSVLARGKHARAQAYLVVTTGRGRALWTWGVNSSLTNEHPVFLAAEPRGRADPFWYMQCDKCLLPRRVLAGQLRLPQSSVTVPRRIISSLSKRTRSTTCSSWLTEPVFRALYHW
jgi:hypothetical protein